jgi:hypothetical protein
VKKNKQTHKDTEQNRVRNYGKKFYVTPSPNTPHVTLCDRVTCTARSIRWFGFTGFTAQPHRTVLCWFACLVRSGDTCQAGRGLCAAVSPCVELP